MTKVFKDEAVKAFVADLHESDAEESSSTDSAGEDECDHAEEEQEGDHGHKQKTIRELITDKSHIHLHQNVIALTMLAFLKDGVRVN